MCLELCNYTKRQNVPFVKQNATDINDADNVHTMYCIVQCLEFVVVHWQLCLKCIQLANYVFAIYVLQT